MNSHKDLQKRFPRLVPLFIFLVTSSCAVPFHNTSKEVSSISPAPVYLAESLVLELGNPVVSLPSGKKQIPVSIKNISNNTFDFCFMDGGISIWGLHPKKEKYIALHIYGAVMDAWCYNKTTLRPGERYMAIEEVWVPTLNDCEAKVTAKVRLHWDNRQYESQEGVVDFTTGERLINFCD